MIWPSHAHVNVQHQTNQSDSIASRPHLSIFLVGVCCHWARLRLQCKARGGGERNTLRMQTSSTSVRYLYAPADIFGVHRVDERIRTFPSIDVHHFVLSKTRNVHFGSRWERVRWWCRRIQVLRFHICRPGKRHGLVWVEYRYKRKLRKHQG